jgi:hypothetical protein
MAYVTRRADKVSSAARGFSLSGAVAMGVGAFALATAVALWTEGADPVARVSGAAAANDPNTPSFDDRFAPRSASRPSADNSSRSLVRSWSSELDIKIRQAKDRLAQKLQSQDLRLALVEEPKQVIEDPKPPGVAAVSLPGAPLPITPLSGVPLPRSRPVEANAEPRNDAPIVRADNRSLLQKFSDLLPGRVTLASLAPDGGIFARKPDLASLGYDDVTAVYDISAHAVYMPDGSKLEAHSGYGSLMDDPAHVNEQNVGATPPNVYDLKPRETLFHGVQALRMISVGDNDTLGRSGLLVHSYMLGPNGDSNGCVSIRNYEKFLKAYSDGAIKRLVVVPKLNEKA